MFLRIDDELLQAQFLTMEAKIVIAHLLSLRRAGCKFYGFYNWFERWNIPASKAEQIFKQLDQLGLIWKNSDGHYEVSDHNIVYEYIEKRNNER